MHCRRDHRALRLTEMAFARVLPKPSELAVAASVLVEEDDQATSVLRAPAPRVP